MHVIISYCLVRYRQHWAALLPTVGMIYSSWSYHRWLNRGKRSPTDCWVCTVCEATVGTVLIFIVICNKSLSVCNKLSLNHFVVDLTVAQRRVTFRIFPSPLSKARNTIGYRPVHVLVFVAKELSSKSIYLCKITGPLVYTCTIFACVNVCDNVIYMYHKQCILLCWQLCYLVG